MSNRLPLVEFQGRLILVASGHRLYLFGFYPPEGFEQEGLCHQGK